VSGAGAPTDLRDYLRSLKDAAGLSFADLAEATGEEERTVKRWFEREPKVPRGDALLRLLGALGVRVEPAPDGYPGAVNAELRALRNMIAHAADLLRQGSGADAERIAALERRLEELGETVETVAKTQNRTLAELRAIRRTQQEQTQAPAALPAAATKRRARK
jgi:transcriptional regulator with XRE-family HTH domain